MKAIVLTLALALGGASFANAPVRPVEKPATLHLQFDDGGSCSGTAIAKDLVLTAAHCFSKDSHLMGINGQFAVVVGELIADGNDHVIVRVQKPGQKPGPVFKQWATLGGPLYQGQQIHFWGGPGGLRDMFRRGYVMGTEQGDFLCDVPVFNGDSGSGIFDEGGRVVGVVSIMFSMGENFHGMGAKPMKFSREQLDKLGL